MRPYKADKVNSIFKYPVIICIGIAIVAVGLRLATFSHSIQDEDEAYYGTIAHTILDGGLPYRDALDHKTPGTYYVYAGVFRLFGKGNMDAVHGVTILWVLGTAYLLYRIGLESYSRAAGNWAALFYTVFTTTCYPKILAANTEIFMLGPLSASALFFLRAIRNPAAPRNYLLSGATCAAATLFKQPALMNMGAMGLYLLAWQPWLTYRAQGWSSDAYASVLRPLLWLGGGFLPVFAVPIVIGYYQGFLGDYIFWAWENPLFHYVGARHTTFIEAAVHNLKYAFLTMAPGTVVWVLSVFHIRYVLTDGQSLVSSEPQQQPHNVWVVTGFLVLWLMASVAGSLATGGGYPHYFLQIWPPAVLLAAPAAAWLCNDKTASPMLRTVNRYWIKGLRYAMILGVVLPALGFQVSFMFRETFWGNYREEYFDFTRLSRWVQAETNPEDKIFVWGWGAMIYFMTDRNPASRFLNCDHVSGRPPGEQNAETARTVPVAPRAWDILMEELNRNKPPLIIDSSPAGYHYYTWYPIKNYPILADYIDEHYEYAANIDGFTAYRRR